MSDLVERLREIAREHGVAGFGRSHAILEAAARARREAMAIQPAAKQMEMF